MISARTLRKWRKEALQDEWRRQKLIDGGDESQTSNKYFELQNRILKMTQILLDQHLFKETRRKS